jgi:hypothetical protein
LDASPLLLQETLDKRLIDGSQEFLYRFAFLQGPLCSNWALENADALRILIKYRINVLGSPEGVLGFVFNTNFEVGGRLPGTYFLEPHLESCTQTDELLSRTIDGGKDLKERRLFSDAVDASQAPFHSL